jgi:hypothetical protein
LGNLSFEWATCHQLLTRQARTNRQRQPPFALSVATAMFVASTIRRTTLDGFSDCHLPY